VLAQVHYRVLRLVRRRGRLPEPEPFASDPGRVDGHGIQELVTKALATPPEPPTEALIFGPSLPYCCFRATAAPCGFPAMTGIFTRIEVLPVFMEWRRTMDVSSFLTGSRVNDGSSATVALSVNSPRFRGHLSSLDFHGPEFA
jgi:hypothetical protein